MRFAAAEVLIIFLVVILPVMVFTILIYWKIFSKAGYNGAMSLLLLVPIANIVVICMLAFGNWPVRQELERLRMQVMGRGQPYPQYPQGPRY